MVFNNDTTCNGFSEGSFSLNNNGYARAHPETEENDKDLPFVYSLHPTRLDRLIWLVMGITLAPIKIVFLLFFLVLAWIPACIAVFNWPLRSSVPFNTWRLYLKNVSVFFVRCAWFSAGVTSVTVKGKQASSRDAPVIIMGPHTSMVDTLAGAVCGFPGVVSVIENAKIPIAGTLFRVNQSIFVERSDPESRKSAAVEIQRRAAAEGAWPQLVVFPEGTCCNGSYLLPYKPGAFLPGVAIQPVTIKYPNRLDTTTWVNPGPGMLALFSLLLCTPVTKMEIEFHPIYKPSTEEQKDAELYMSNVRRLMGKLLNLPMSDSNYRHLIEMVKKYKPNRGVISLWSHIFTTGYVEMPDLRKAR